MEGQRGCWHNMLLKGAVTDGVIGFAMKADFKSEMSMAEVELNWYRERVHPFPGRTWSAQTVSGTFTNKSRGALSGK
jgi:hypothetical protein